MVLHTGTHVYITYVCMIHTCILVVLCLVKGKLYGDVSNSQIVLHEVHGEIGITGDSECPPTPP